eukprot:UN11251
MIGTNQSLTLFIPASNHFRSNEGRDK